MYNSSTIALAKNPVFHDINKHIDTRFHYLCKDFVPRIFSQSHSNIMFFFFKMRDMLGVIKKSSLRGDDKSKPDFIFPKK